MRVWLLFFLVLASRPTGSPRGLCHLSRRIVMMRLASPCKDATPSLSTRPDLTRRSSAPCVVFRRPSLHRSRSYSASRITCTTVMLCSARRYCRVCTVCPVEFLHQLAALGYTETSVQIPRTISLAMLSC